MTFTNASFGTNGNVPQQSVQRKWQFRGDVSKTVGKHTLKGGIDYIWNPVEGGFFKFNETLEVDFAKNPSTILGNPSQYPQGFGTPGLVSAMSYSTGDPTFLVATKQLGLYFQDDWKATPRLTLNLGLRWDKDFNTLGVSDISKSRTYQELVAINDPISNFYIRKLPHNSNKDFSPRVGFAYDITGAAKHVLRGGFGLYFGNTFQNIPLFMEQQSNPTIFQTVLSLSAASDPVPCTTKTLGQWQYGIDPMPCLPGPLTQLANGSVGRIIDPDYRNPVAEEFNLGYSWALNPTSVVEVEYTHVLSLHENKTINIDQKVPAGPVVDGSGNVVDVNLVRPLTAAFQAAGQPRLNSVRNEASINRSRYDGVNFSYRQRRATASASMPTTPCPGPMVTIPEEGLTLSSATTHVTGITRWAHKSGARLRPTSATTSPLAEWWTCRRASSSRLFCSSARLVPTVRTIPPIHSTPAVERLLPWSCGKAIRGTSLPFPGMRPVHGSATTSPSSAWLPSTTRSAAIRSSNSICAWPRTSGSAKA